jgi:hypothetical protein
VGSDATRGERLVDAQRLLEAFPFAAFRVEVLRVLQQQPTRPFEHVLVQSFLGLALELAAEVAEPVVEELDDVKAIEHQRRLRKVLLDRQNVGLRHVEGDGFDLRSRRTQAPPERLQGLGSLAVADEDDGAAFEVEHHGEVAMPLADGDLVDAQETQMLELGLGEALLQVPLLDVLDGVPTDAEMMGHVLDGHALGQLQGIAFEGMGVTAHGIGEVDGNLAEEPAGAAFDARDLKEQMSRAVADRQAAKESRFAAVTGELVRPAGGAAEAIAILFDREHDFPFEVFGAGITVAANAEAVVE